MADKTDGLPINEIGRMDFTFEVVHANYATRTLTVRMIPDPRRYETIIEDGQTWYQDKYLHHRISLDGFIKAMKDLPIYHLASSIKSAPEYARARRQALERELTTGEYSTPEEKAARHRPLESDLRPRRIAFLSVDICGGTALRRADRQGFESAHKLFMQELGTVVGQFNGAIMKSTGDGFIAYVDHPSFTSLCDATIDLGLSFLVVLRDSINPALENAGLKPLRIRVGADYGDAQFRSIVIPTTGFSTPEVASDAVAAQNPQPCALLRKRRSACRAFDAASAWTSSQRVAGVRGDLPWERPPHCPTFGGISGLGCANPWDDACGPLRNCGWP
jgi:class 3 adenylate cyclase